MNIDITERQTFLNLVTASMRTGYAQLWPEYLSWSAQAEGPIRETCLPTIQIQNVYEKITLRLQMEGKVADRQVVAQLCWLVLRLLVRMDGLRKREDTVRAFQGGFLETMLCYVTLTTCFTDYLSLETPYVLRQCTTLLGDLEKFIMAYLFPDSDDFKNGIEKAAETYPSLLTNLGTLLKGVERQVRALPDAYSFELLEPLYNSTQNGLAETIALQEWYQRSSYAIPYYLHSAIRLPLKSLTALILMMHTQPRQ